LRPPFLVEFGWSADASGGVSKWIPFVDLAAKGSASDKALHKVKLTLEIAGARSKGLISDDDGPTSMRRSD